MGSGLGRIDGSFLLFGVVVAEIPTSNLLFMSTMMPTTRISSNGDAGIAIVALVVAAVAADPLKPGGIGRRGTWIDVSFACLLSCGLGLICGQLHEILLELQNAFTAQRRFQHDEDI